MELKIDQEFKNLIPPLSFDERTGLKENLMKNGCLDSIKTWNSIVIDGHNRYDICMENNLTFKTDELSFNDRNDAKIWMIRQQLDKRNVNDYIRTSLCLKMEGIYQEKAKVNMVTASHPTKSENVALTTLSKQVSKKIKSDGTHESRPPEDGIQENTEPLKQNKIIPINTREELAKAAGVSEGTVAKVKYIEDKATDEQKEDLSKSKTSIHKVYTELKDQYEPKPEPEPEKPKEEDTDHCVFTPFIPYKSQVSICPCGCGYGYCEINEIWYSPDEILELEGE